MPTTFYHVSYRALTEGTFLTQGAYGERVRSNDFVQNHYAQHLKEEIFEAVRQSHYPQRPSRLNCIFLYPELSIAKAYHAHIGRYKTYIYEVSLSQGQTFVAEMDLLHCEGLRYAQIVQQAHRYWSGQQHPQSLRVEKLLVAPSVLLD
jgi:hypothetical protein